MAHHDTVTPVMAEPIRVRKRPSLSELEERQKHEKPGKQDRIAAPGIEVAKFGSSI